MFKIKKAYSRSDVMTELLVNRALAIQGSTGLKEAHRFLTRHRIKAQVIKRVLSSPNERRA
ncbi:hypothetical protein [Massilia endophytica]|uniref:hypothetical protein n=1 Tax=Massilia endophytica TaxID=2899220 RepID=UPI001E40D39E|nr:hypothetical protein [Massilia endophytica]UGQ47827.1 hypothetical protein LSQ66_04980 [Massilia endophytica]